MRKLVDANVVLRYLLHDDENQFPTAERTIHGGAYLLPEVLAEIVYVQVLHSNQLLENVVLSKCTFELLKHVVADQHLIGRGFR